MESMVLMHELTQGLAMLDYFYRVVTNILFLVPLRVRRFHAKNPQVRVLAAGATKARKFKEESAVQHEIGWIVSRRSALILADDRLVCGSWEIPLSSITQASLMRYKALFARALVLKIATTDNIHYQFGLQYDPAWEKQTALKIDIEDGKIKYSLFSIIIRIIVIVLLIQYIIQHLV